MKPLAIKGIINELIDENPFACRALLRIVGIEFTTVVPTLAVTTGNDPKLLINLDFVAEHCATEAHVKAVICHEFLHVLLRHTERIKPLQPIENLAMDAVINAIIHRELGQEYSSFMQQFYANETGLLRLLRRWSGDELAWDGGYFDIGWYEPMERVWISLYAGKLLVDDILDIAADLKSTGRIKEPVSGWLGNHDDVDASGTNGESADGVTDSAEAVSPVVREALDRALKSMNGEGIWRAPNGRGVGASVYRNQVGAADEDVSRWCRHTLSILQRYLMPDRRALKNMNSLTEGRLPVLTPGDRRGFSRALWSPFIPDSVWQYEQMASGGSAQVYLDVSGSMSAEMPLIIALLARLGKHIRRPFWVFSDVVAPAVIKNNRLHADTTGGTSMACVLEHVAETRPESAVVVTDGYIESISQKLLDSTRSTRLHAIVTRDGSPAALQRAGIGYTQLGSLPK